MSRRLQYRFLGNSGLRVSDICLGAMTFGEAKPEEAPALCSEELSHRLLDRYAEWGGNFIDTADVYQYGQSEEIIGRWLSKRNRDDFVIATKARGDMSKGKNSNAGGLSRIWLMRAVEDSLRRLQTDYIDLYQTHVWDDGVSVEETYGALNDLVRMGKVRYIGVSNVCGWQLQQIHALCKHRGWAPVVSLQQQYSLLCRESEWEPFEVCRRQGIGVLPWSPLKGGWLSGKVKRGVTANDLTEGSRLAWTSSKEGRQTQSHSTLQQFEQDENVWKLLDFMEKIGEEHGKSIAQVALKWLLQKDIVSSVIIGVKTLEQLEDNLGASGDWRLTAEQMTALDAMTAPVAPYPYEMVTRLNKSRARAKPV